MKVQHISYQGITGKLTLLLAVLVLTACEAEDDAVEVTTPVINPPVQITPTPVSIDNPAKSTGFGSVPSLELSDPNFVGDHFSGSGACGVCHNGMIDDTGKDVSIETAWQTSTMANSARDPYWRAKAAATIKNHPSLTHEVDDTCTRCHAPMANEAAKKANVELTLISGGLDSSNPFFDHAMDGVSCSLCHQIEDNGILGTEESTSGNFTIAEFAPADRENRPAYGQYADPIGAYMVANSEFTPVYGAHISESAMCGTCHDLETPKLDENGEVIPDNPSNHFQEQQTFTEWQNSDYRDGGSSAATCQACHMPRIETTSTLASSGTDIRRPNFAEHTFLGANTVMQDMLNNFRDELGVQAEGFPEAIQRNREFLKTSAELQIVGTRSEDDTIIATLKIENHTGHKLPSGYPSRRVFVHFAVTDENGAVIFESGKTNADGSITGADGDVNYNHFEPHYNAITREDQVLIFEGIMADINGDVTHSLVEGVRYAKDNRLTPKGFDKNNVDNDIAVVGVAETDDNFNSGLDLFEYRIPVSVSGTYNIIAELVYQPLAYGHLEYLFKDTDLPEVDQFKTIYDATDRKTETISTAIESHNHP